MAFWLYITGKLSTLVHLWKCFSSTEIIGKKIILEGIHLHWNINIVSYNSTILEVI